MWLQFEVDGDKSHFEWGNGMRPHPTDYSIPKETLKRAVDGFLAPLNRLSEWARSGRLDQLGDILRQIAVAGSRLRFVLFSTPQDISGLKEWIAEQYESGDRSLSITADPDFHVPWGLVYDGDPNQIPEGAGSIEDFER